MCDIAPPDGRVGIDAALVRRLIAAQFPRWAHLQVSRVEADGNDNRTYRLGEDLTVRLPTADCYAAAVAKEDHWLRFLAPLLPLPVPEPVALGAPGEGYPFQWSVRRWLPGETASVDRISDLRQFAADLAEFLRALQRIDTMGGPPAGIHSFYRGASLTHYDEETRQCLSALKGRIDTSHAEEVWDAALSASWQGPPVWFHGDVAVGNLLVRDGRLAAVIDFGIVGVGDPACDLVITWTFLSGDARERFRQAIDQDAATRARARGWALWKALLGLAHGTSTDGQTPSENRHVIEHVLADQGPNSAIS